MPRQLQVALCSLFLLPVFAHAEVACESAAVLRTKAKSCDDNAAYYEAAKNCVEQFEKSSASAQAAAASALARFTHPGQQEKALGNAKKGFQTAMAALRSLEGVGKRLEAQVRAYKNEVVWPEDFGAATSAGLSATTFLANQSCYNDTQKLLDTYAEILKNYSQQAALTARLTEQLAQRAGTGEAGLDGGTAVKTEAKRPAPRQAPLPGRKASGPHSDITGTEEEQNKKK